MKPIYIALLLAWSSAGACSRRAPALRTDLEPILARVQLPAEARDVAWIAEPVVQGGCIPAHDSPTRIHAFVSGYGGGQAGGTPGHIDVPLVVADEILPASLRAKGVTNGDAIRLEGSSPNKKDLERPDKAEVRHAVVTKEGLVLELWVR